MSFLNAKTVLGAAAIIASTAISAPAAIVNGSFDADTTGWTLNGIRVGFQSNIDHTGNAGGSAYLYQYADGVSQLDQWTAVTPNTEYELTWWSTPNFDTGSNTTIPMQVFVFGSDFGTILNQGYETGTRASPAWGEHTVSFNSGDSSSIGIRFQGADGGWDNIFLDDVSLTPVPEPTAVLGLLGLGSIAILRRRRA